jgi:oxaloacetate decarboxylase (Na+ extruding) subunit gamma
MNPESVTSLLLEAGSLMLIGMVFVFSFLGLLIIGIHLIARFCEIFPGNVENVKSTSAPTPQVSRSGVDGKVIAAISAAIHTHHNSTKS